MIRADTLSYYHCICRHIQSQTVSAHNASCESYSSHIETEILAMKLSNELKALLLYLLLTAESENNNGSPADIFLQFECRLVIIIFLKICQVLTNDDVGLDTCCKLIAILSSILYWS